jgi:16S rRNA U516 pseudouridylate synthase RsuA-like enzyme
MRIRYGHLELPRSLSRGQYAELSPTEVQKLLS